MNVPQEKWPEAFAALEPTAADEAACPPSEEIWDAVAGRLSRERTRAIIDLVATNPAVAEAWRTAVHMGAGDQATSANVAGPTTVVPPASSRPAPSQGFSRYRTWMAIAAGLMLGVIGLWQLRLQSGPVSTTRDGDQATIESLLVDEARLPRSDFRLRWRGEEDGARFDVRVLTETLEPVAEAFDLSAGIYRVAPDALAAFPDGTRLLWQVVEHTLGGAENRSPTFSVIVVDVSSELSTP